MFASPTDGKDWRSLEADDIAGVQAIYGVRDTSKPRIQGLSLNGETLMLAGTGFAAVENEVWFAGNDSILPLKVADVPSQSGGTLVEVSVPAGTNSGDVFLYTTLGGGEALSNAWPLDTAGTGCAPALNFCEAEPNSTGSASTIGIAGSQSVSDNSLLLYSLGSPPSGFGLFFYSRTPGYIPVGEGLVCLGGPFYRLSAVATDSQGRATHPLDLTAPPTPGAQIEPGSKWYFLWWYRDLVGGPVGYNFSDAICIPFCE